MTIAASPSVIYIAFPFPPSRGAGVYRAVATTNHLINSGWNVTVIAPAEDYFLRYQGTEDRSLLKWVDERTEVIRVPVRNWLRENRLSELSLIEVISPRLDRRRKARIARYLSPLDHYPFWLIPAFRAALRAGRRNGADVFLATGNPFNSFVAAAVAARLLKVPYVLDFRDAWTFDQFTGDIKPMASDVALPLERRLLNRAGAFISVNRPIIDWLAAHHSVPPSVKRRVIPNGYDPEFIARSEASNGNRSEVRYAHVGTLVPQKMDWREMLRQFDRAAREMEDQVTLDVYGHLGFSARQETELRRAFEAAATVAYRGPVPRNEVREIYDAADVLYLPLYESPYVTSGKVYEMMATRKPILAWGVDTAGALEPLRGYPKLVRADPSRPNTLARSMSAANELSRLESTDLETRTERYVSQYSRENALEPLDPLLRSLISQRRR